ncbi:hypothetical protein EES42_27660 [Streptomyces sp. ADI95-17]|nr:hypothetical protein EES42_27660 [Streptomyces sp. ADI95-17]
MSGPRSIRRGHGSLRALRISARPFADACGGCPGAYLPGLTMQRIADLYPGEAKTDAKDAFIIADAARAMPHTLRAIDGEDETIAPSWR